MAAGGFAPSPAAPGRCQQCRGGGHGARLGCRGPSPEIPRLRPPRVLGHPRVLPPGLQGGLLGAKRGTEPPQPPSSTKGKGGPRLCPRLLDEHSEVGVRQFSNSRATCVKVTNIY